MAVLLFVGLVIARLFSTTASATPSPQSIGSGVTILTHNDLYGNFSARDESLLVLSDGLSYDAATAACKSLGETLWTPSEADFLPYLAHSGQGGQYWTQSGCANLSSSPIPNSSGQCDKNQRLPALCTNSASYSTAAKQDNSTYWQIKTQTGETAWTTGFRDKVSFRFQGVRYAAQPKRFTHSKPYETNNDTSALTYQSACVQAPNVGSEDCLFLNIWTPHLPFNASGDDSNTTLKPIMLNIHGGAFTGGTGNDPTFDGGALASRGDVVVVNINYRLTTLGFLALNDGSTNGNYGIGDQITALDWVHANIRAFGGDPNRITILGQSAGAASVRALMASPKAIGKFAAAIPQSNLAGYAYATTYSEYYNISTEYEVAAKPILNATGCLNATSQVDCLRQIDPFVLANLSTVARYVVQDGTYITSDRLQLTGAGPTANVPLMLGFMRDDGASFITYPKSATNTSAVLDAAGFTSQQLTPSALDLYPTPSGPNVTTNIYNASSALTTDSEFRCLDIATAYSGALHNTFPSVYVYEFNRSYDGYDPNPPVCSAPPTPDFPNGDPSQEYFKCHSGELSYVFGTHAYMGRPDRDGLDTPMSQFVLDTWASFARTYDPNLDPAFLAARGFTNTTQAANQAGKFDKLSPEEPSLRVFQWPSYQAGLEVFSSQEKCDTLGLPLDFYER
nr:AN12g09310 [Kwoniella heveanensis]